MGKKYTYCIFYLEKKYWRKVQEQIEEAGYIRIRAIVPTVKVLNKSSRGKISFTDVPVLFNYGFVRMPVEWAFSRPFLNQLKRKIPGIKSWLKDTVTIHPRKKKVRIDNAEDFDDFSRVATITRKQLREYLNISKKNDKYSLDDAVRYKKGDYVILKGYPYEGVGATVKKVHYKSRTITLKIIVLHGTMEITLPFDNVIYSVYNNYDPNVIQATFNDYDYESLTEEKVDNFINRKSY